MVVAASTHSEQVFDGFRQFDRVSENRQSSKSSMDAFHAAISSGLRSPIARGLRLGGGEIVRLGVEEVADLHQVPRPHAHVPHDVV